MENHLYTCQYCGIEYKPKRRQKQKYCSNSCRTRAFTIRKLKGLNIACTDKKNIPENKTETMSWAGVGNAAAGTLAVNLATKLFTKEDSKPATKKDIKEVKELLLKRYHEIKNMKPNSSGKLPFYDIQNKIVTYLKK